MLISDIIIHRREERKYQKYLKDRYSYDKNGSLKKRTKVFVCYSHADSECLERVKVHLKALENEGIEIEEWDDTQIKAGKKWEREIENALDEARIALLLISPDFLASDFIIKIELPSLLDTAAKDGTVILPLIVKPSRFSRNKILSQFQAINDPEKPLKRLSETEQDEILVGLANTIEEYLKKL